MLDIILVVLARVVAQKTLEEATTRRLLFQFNLDSLFVTVHHFWLCGNHFSAFCHDSLVLLRLEVSLIMVTFLA